MDTGTKFIENEIKTYNETHKWLWTVLMGFAFVASTRTLIDVIWDDDTSRATYSWPEIACYIVFVTFIYRFYVGDRRILDYVYGSAASAFAATDAATFQRFLSLITPRILALDSAGRVIQMMFFIGPALLIGHPRFFIAALSLLLLANGVFCLVWIFMTAQRRNEFTALADSVLGSEFKYKRYRWTWTKNNLLFGVIGLAVYLFTDKIAIWIGAEPIHIAGATALLLLVNSFIDFKACNAVYLPDFSLLYDSVPQPDDDEQLLSRIRQGARNDVLVAVTQDIESIIKESASSVNVAVLRAVIEQEVAKAIEAEGQRLAEERDKEADTPDEPVEPPPAPD